MEQDILQRLVDLLESGVNLSALTLALLLIVAGVGATVGSYLKLKGQNLATKEDIGEITTITGEIRSHFDRQLEEYAHENKLRLAALEKRLEAHQRAYTLWRKLGNSIHEGTLESVYLECEEWWDENCLYLSPEARGAFRDASRAAIAHDRHFSSNTKLAEKHWDEFWAAGEIILRSAGLPGFSKGEERDKDERGARRKSS